MITSMQSALVSYFSLTNVGKKLNCTATRAILAE